MGQPQESFTLAMESVSSFVQKSTAFVKFSLDGKILSMEGAYGYDPGLKVARIIFLGGTPHGCAVDGLNVGEWSHDTNTGEFVVPVGKPLTGDFSVSINNWEIEIIMGDCNKL
jgi:alpha-glucosidase